MSPEANDQRRFPSPTLEDRVANAIAEYDLAHNEDNRVKEAQQRVIEAQQEEIEALTAKLYIDKQTGVYNEYTFKERLPALIEQAKKNKAPIALVLADTDGLKRTNDTLGHPAGDDLLVASANAIREGSRETDTVGRLSGNRGDEFYAILWGFTPTEGVTSQELFDETVQKYRDAIGEEIAKLDMPDELKVGVSFGIGVLTEQDLEAYTHLSNEDLAKLLRDRAEAELMKSKQLVGERLREQGIEFQDDRRLEGDRRRVDRRQQVDN